MKKMRTMKWVLVLLTAAAVLLIAVGSVRLAIARKAANEFADGQSIDVHFETVGEADSKEAFLTELQRLAEWEEKTQAEINSAFGCTDNEEYASRDTDSMSGYEKKEELLAYAVKEKWRELRRNLDHSVNDTITQLFEKNRNTYGLDEDSVRTCYRNGYFEKIAKVMESVENGAGMKAFNQAGYALDEDWSALPMDIAYGLRPKLILAGSEAALLSAVKGNELYSLRSAVDKAESFENRYHVTVDGLESARKTEARLEYYSKPDVPAVGMSTSEARSTRLGAPTMTTKETGSWSHQKHTYGDLVWEKGGRQVFRAHYSDGEITDVYDTRNSTAKSPWTSSLNGSSRSSSSKSGSSKSGSSGPSFDPDDHDIEAYFEDNRDEYGDYDEAYEGFLDDEGVWDDY